MSEGKEPKGIVAIVTSPLGLVVTAADFDRQSYGGFKLWEAQRHRAVQKVKFATVRAYCSDIVTSAIDTYVAEQIFQRLEHQGKHKITLRAVGYDDDIRKEIER